MYSPVANALLTLSANRRCGYTFYTGFILEFSDNYSLFLPSVFLTPTQGGAQQITTSTATILDLPSRSKVVRHDWMLNYLSLLLIQFKKAGLFEALVRLGDKGEVRCTCHTSHGQYCFFDCRCILFSPALSHLFSTTHE